MARFMCAFAALALIAATMPAQYCAGGAGFGLCSSDESISNVQIDTWNNPSGCPGLPNYSDFTGIAGPNLSQGTSYPITVTVVNWFAPDQVRCWGDWNGNEIFTDAGEETVLAYIGGGVFSGAIAVSPTSVATTRLRVRLAYNVTPLPCGIQSFGEVEDYTVNVGAGDLSAAPAVGTNPVSQGSSTLLTLTMTSMLPPNPPVVTSAVVDLTAIGGPVAQTLYDDGITGGDAAAGDNVWSFDAFVPPATGTGLKTLPYSVLDSIGRTAAGNFALTVIVPPPVNDECSGALALLNGQNGPFDNTNATNSPGFTTPCGAAGSLIGNKDMFFSYTGGAACAQDIEIKTCDPSGFLGNNQDTQITVWDGLADCPTPAGAPIACNDDAGSGCGTLGFQSRVNFTANPGQAYLIRVSSWGANSGTFKVTVTPGPGTRPVMTLGAGCSDGGGPGPSLTVDAPPVFDTVITFSIAGAAPGSVGMLFISPPGAPTAMPGGCTLFVVNGSMQFLGFLSIDGTGATSFAAYVPEIPEWECLPVYMQGVTLPGTPFYQLTDGLLLTLGY